MRKAFLAFLVTLLSAGVVTFMAKDLSQSIAQAQRACTTPQMSQDQLITAAVDSYNATSSQTNAVAEPAKATVKQASWHQPPSVSGLEPEQIKNAKIIIAIGHEYGLSDRDIIIALMTALQESGLRNLHHGDGLPGTCSLGVFQQQWCLEGHPWGDSPEDVLNVPNATKMFYDALVRVKNRGSMRLTEAAQAVQGSAFPNAYAKHESMARAILAAYGGSTGDVNTDPVAAEPGCTNGMQAIDAAIEAAEAKVGSKVDAGNSLPGLALLSTAYSVAGVTLDATNTSMVNGVSVDNRGDLTRGDLVYLGGGKKPSRVAMMLGDGQLIGVDSSGEATKFAMDWDQYVGAVRPVPLPYLVVPVGIGGSGGGVSASGWVVPLQGSYDLNSPYGGRGIICTPGGCTSSFHDGQDMAAPEGRPILAAASGKIIEKATSPYGWHVVIDHGGGITTLYGHMSAFANGLVEGKTVSAGETIGYVGHTGKATGPHLHFTVRVDGKPVNPVVFMKNHGVKL